MHHKYVDGVLCNAYGAFTTPPPPGWVDTRRHLGHGGLRLGAQVLGLGTDTGDSAPSALPFFDHHRFLFNVGEGFQRFCVQHRIRMSRTSGIFATRSNTQGLGGLPGGAPLPLPR